MQKIRCFFNLIVLVLCTACTHDKYGELRSQSSLCHEIFNVVKPQLDTNKTHDLLNEKYGKEAEAFMDDFKHNHTPQPLTLNAIGQVAFLRKQHEERSSLVAQPRFKTYANALFPLFTQLGDVEDVYPGEKEYDYILLNGSTVLNMRERLHTLSDLVQRGAITLTSQTQIVFLTGNRDLFSPQEEGSLNDPHPFTQDSGWKPSHPLPKSEYEAAQWVWAQSQLPDQLRAAKIIFVNAPKTQSIHKETGKVIWVRPTTAGTIKTWMQTNPKPGKCLVISSQPFVYYQVLTTRKNLGANFDIHGAGQSTMSQESFPGQVDIFLDNLARCLYTEVTS